VFWLFLLSSSKVLCCNHFSSVFPTRAYPETIFTGGGELLVWDHAMNILRGCLTAFLKRLNNLNVRNTEMSMNLLQVLQCFLWLVYFTWVWYFSSIMCEDQARITVGHLQLVILALKKKWIFYAALTAILFSLCIQDCGKLSWHSFI
jgi:hypothetical protein